MAARLSLTLSRRTQEIANENLLRVLISVFDGLKYGDSWTAATTLGVWQRSALGLNGSYSSANIRALKRGVALRRVFVVSVEELGRDYCARLAELLTGTSDTRNVVHRRIVRVATGIGAPAV